LRGRGVILLNPWISRIGLLFSASDFTLRAATAQAGRQEGAESMIKFLLEVV